MSDFLSKEPVAPTSGGVVRASKLGEDERFVEISGPTSVAEVLDRANLTVDAGQSVSVNGVIEKNLEGNVEPGAIVVVTGNISNG